jgi:hypothetical protein
LADFSSTLKMEAIRSSERQFTISTWRHIPEDGIIHSRRRENLKSYIAVHHFRKWIGAIMARITQVCAFTFVGN